MTKIVFRGIIEKRSSGGCSACRKRTTESRFVTIKTYILPSGVTKTFRVGVAEDVSDRDAAFLLSYRYETKTGEVKHAFEVI